MKVLYAIQGTGNGHVSRARDIIPLLQQYGDLAIFISGNKSQVDLGYPIKYQSKGLTFEYNKSGGISYFKTLITNNPFRILREVFTFPVRDYDVIINDFESITAWAAKLKGKEVVGLGHQASFLSNKTPRPEKKSWIGELILKHYAPCTRPIGFHFDEFDTFIHKPVIRKPIREAKTEKLNHYTVYLPAYDDAKLIALLSQIPETEWHIFSKRTKEKYQKQNCTVHPVDNTAFVKSFTTCTGVLTSAGFETPAEALFMGKKLFVIPIKGQYEQYCNALGAKELGASYATALNSTTIRDVKQWVLSGKAVKVNYPDDTAQIIASIFNQQ